MSTHSTPLLEAFRQSSQIVLHIPIIDVKRAEKAVASLFTEGYAMAFGDREFPTRVEKVERIGANPLSYGWPGEHFEVTLGPKVSE